MKFINYFKKNARRIKRTLIKDTNSFTGWITGVIHVGANSGQERIFYANRNLDVVWVEPNPEIFIGLKKNLEGFPRQKAYKDLITDKDNEIYTFHIANNDGASSSIFELNLHKDIWPEVSFLHSTKLTSLTLKSFVEKNKIPVDNYQALIIDTQGAELLVLKGAGNLLKKFKYIKVEVADFESYKGCCQVLDVDQFLKINGFKEFCREKFASRENGGSYYDILYKRKLFVY